MIMLIRMPVALLVAAPLLLAVACSEPECPPLPPDDGATYHLGPGCDPEWRIVRDPEDWCDYGAAHVPAPIPGWDGWASRARGGVCTDRIDLAPGMWRPARDLPDVGGAVGGRGD